MAHEEKILSRVDDQEVIQLSQELAEHVSFPGEEGDCARFLAGRLKGMGFDTVELQEVEPGRPNVIATLKGSGGGPRFMFNGHLDVDPLPDGYDKPIGKSWIEGNVLWGTGLGNMKAADACMIGAALAVRRSGIPLKGDIIVAGVIGELSGGIGAKHLVENNPIPDVGIVPEPTGSNVRTVHAGCLQLLIHTIGKMVWVGSLDRLPHVNAMEKMMLVLDALEKIEWSCGPHSYVSGLPRLAVGGIRGGLGRQRQLWRPGKVGDFCTLLVDIRTAPHQSMESAVADLRRALDQIGEWDPEFKYEIELPPATYEQFGANAAFHPPLDLPLDDPLVKITADRHRYVNGSDCSIGFYDPGSYACADSGWLFSKGCRCLNYGPSTHVPNADYVLLDKMAAATRVMALVAADVCG